MDKFPPMLEILRAEFEGNLSDVIKVTRENIALLNSIKNSGVMEGEGITSRYVPLMASDIYREQLEDHIMNLTKNLVKYNIKMFDNESKQIS